MATKKSIDDAVFSIVEIVKSGKNKGQKRYKKIFGCTVAESVAILAICEQYPPETPLEEVRKKILNIAGIHEKFQMFINAGATKVGDVIGYGNDKT